MNDDDDVRDSIKPAGLVRLESTNLSESSLAGGLSERSEGEHSEAEDRSPPN